MVVFIRVSAYHFTELLRESLKVELKKMAITCSHGHFSVFLWMSYSALEYSNALTPIIRFIWASSKSAVSISSEWLIE